LLSKSQVLDTAATRIPRTHHDPKDLIDEDYNDKIVFAVNRLFQRSDREADHSLPSSAEVKNALNYTSTPPIRLHGVILS